MPDIKNNKIPNKIKDLAQFSGFSYITRMCTYMHAYMRVYTGAGAREAEVGEGEENYLILHRLHFKKILKFEIYFQITLQQNPEA